MAPLDAALLSAAEVIENRQRCAFVEVSPWRDMTDDADPVGGSIPGAHLANVRTHFAGTPTETSGHLPLPDLDAVRAIAARWRGADGSRIILYTRRIEEFTSATRAWFVLSAAGVTSVSVLDGGLPAWVRAGGGLARVEHDEGADIPPSGPARPGSSSGLVRVLETSDVEDVARFGTLLDARSADAYHGTVGLPRTGHVPGALHAPALEVLRPDGTLIPPASLRRWFLIHRALGRHEVGAYCNGGVASSALAFAGALVGQPVGLYVDSWSAWEKQPALPVEQGAPQSQSSGQDVDCLDHGGVHP